MKRHTLLFALVLTTSPLVARADDNAEARRLHQQGMAAVAAGDFARAADAFRAAYEASGDTRSLWNLALAENRAGRAYDALRHFREYVTKADAMPNDVRRAHEMIPALTSKVAVLTIAAPQDADVLVDGKSVGKGPLVSNVEVDPDRSHVVVARLGSDEAKREWTPSGPGEKRVELAFPERVAPPAPPPAPIAAPAPIDHGSPPHARAGALRTWMTVGLGVGAAALAAGGVYMGIRSNAAASDAASLRAGMPNHAWCTDPSAAGCAQLRSDLDAQNADHMAAVVLYAGAGALAAGAIASWLFLPRAAEGSRPSAIVPVFGPGQIGGSYVTEF